MKPIIPFALLSAFLAVGAQGAATDPVGYISLGDTVGLNAVAAGSETTFSVPLNNPVEFSGTADAGATATTITLKEILVAGAYDAPSPGAPWLVEVASGGSEGIQLPIVSNTATTITVMVGGGDDLASVAEDDVIRIRRAWTLETFFASTAIPDGTNVLTFDSQTSTNNAPSTPNYVYASGFGGWLDDVGFGLANDLVLYPGESFVLFNNTATAIPSVVITGEVPIVKSRMRISKDGAGAQDTRIGYFSPVGEIIDNAGFTPTDGDNLLFWDNTAVGLNKAPSANSLVYAGGFGGWLDGVSFAVVGPTFTLNGGEGYVYRRDASAPIGDQVVVDEQDYISTL